MSNQTYNYIFLDLDGPVLDGKIKHYNCYRDIIKCLGGIPIDLEYYWFLKRHKEPLDMILKLSQLNKREKEFIELWKKKIETKEYLCFDELKFRIPETLSELRKCASHLWLVTNRMDEMILKSQLKELKIESYFERVICTRSSMADAKYQALKGIDLKKSLIIGDTEAELHTSKLLNIEFLAIYNGLRTKSFFKDETGVEDLYELLEESI